MSAGKCPRCDQPVTQLRLHGTKASEAFKSDTFTSITLCCPSCDTILSAQIDPIALKHDIVHEILSKLGVAQP